MKRATNKEPDDQRSATASMAVAAALNKGIAAFGKGNYKTPLKQLKSLAEKGVAEAQAYLGVMYSKGLGVKQDDAHALDCYQKAAAQGHAGAENNLGGMYEYGDGVLQDPEKAFYWYRRSQKHGFAESAINLDRVREHFRSSIDHATFDAPPTDLAKSDQWIEVETKLTQFKKLPDQKDQSGGMQLFSDIWSTGDLRQCEIAQGVFYQLGKQEREAAEREFELCSVAAAKGDANTQIRLGLMYRYGTGVKEDSAKAIACFEKAAVQGSAHAASELGKVYLEGNIDIRNGQKAVEWFEHAAFLGDIFSALSLSDMYLNGDGVPQDVAKGNEWLEACRSRTFKSLGKPISGLA